MSDPTTMPVTDPAAVAPAPTPDPVPAPAPAAAAEAPKAPPYLNPWASRAKAAPKAPVAAPKAQASSVAVAAPDPRVDALMAVLGETVTQDLSSVPANVAATIRAIAGSDPVAQRKALNAMRANGLASVASTAIAAPASTTMPTAAVAVTASPANTDASRLAEYEKLSRVAPILASQYRAAHGAAIERATKSRPNN